MPLVSAGVWLDDGANAKAYPPPVRRRQADVDIHPLDPTHVLNIFGPYPENVPAPRYAPCRSRPEGTSFLVPQAPQDFFAWPELTTRFPSRSARGRPDGPVEGPLAPAVGLTDPAFFAVWREDQRPPRYANVRARAEATVDAFPPFDRSPGWSLILDQSGPRYAPLPRRAPNVEFCPLPIDDFRLAWLPADAPPVRRAAAWRPTETPGLFVSILVADGLKAFADDAPSRRTMPQRLPSTDAFDAWQASGVVLIVAGPYFASALDLFAAGAVAGDVKGS